MVITDQWLTRGLFKRLDGVIAYPEEITNRRLRFGIDDAALQLHFRGADMPAGRLLDSCFGQTRDATRCIED